MSRCFATTMAIVVACGVGCTPARVATKTPGPLAGDAQARATRITLRRDSRREAYEISIRGDGEVRWHGVHGVSRHGYARSHVDPRRVALLLDQMRAAGFCDGAHDLTGWTSDVGDTDVGLETPAQNCAVSRDDDVHGPEVDREIDLETAIEDLSSAFELKDGIPKLVPDGGAYGRDEVEDLFVDQGAEWIAGCAGKSRGSGVERIRIALDPIGRIEATSTLVSEGARCVVEASHERLFVRVRHDDRLARDPLERDPATHRADGVRERMRRVSEVAVIRSSGRRRPWT